MVYDAQSFLKKIKPYVIEDMRKSGILASLTAAQAFIESRKGNSDLTVQANNLFGMKGLYNGESVKMSTKEWVNGQYVKIIAPFRKYPSWAESIADHSDLFNKAKRYENLRGLRDYKLACTYVKQDGYCTEPKYTQILLSTIEKYKLYEWDAEALDGANPYREPISNIRLGMTGNAVKWIQYQLNLYGYKLKVDGIFGRKTDAAVKDFQENHQLVDDGIVGKLTRAALKEVDNGIL